jgi:PAS domain S-box-containing protein
MYRTKSKDASKHADLGNLHLSSNILRTHLAMIQSEREMLELRHVNLDRRQQFVQQEEERVHAAKLRSSEQRFHVLVESLPCIVCHLDREQRFRYCNKAFGESFGLSSNKVRGKCLWDVIGNKDYDAMRPGIVTALQGGEVTYELGLLEHTERHFYCKFVPERLANDSVVGFFVMLLDISDRKAVEKRLSENERTFRNLAKERAHLLNLQQKLLENTKQASRSKDLLLATISHELRTPLSAILGWARLLRQKKVEADRLDAAFESIERNARHQAKLIDELLDVSRIAYGKIKLKLEKVNVSALVRSIIDTVRPVAAERKLRLQFTSEDERRTHAKADPHRLQQVIDNLVSNSLKFTPQGGSIKVAVRRDETHVRIEVTDNGKGISPDFLPHIFETFQQENISSNRSISGLGLGLAISERLVKLHNGTLTAKSEGLGLGATFEVALPSWRLQRRTARNRASFR